MIDVYASISTEWGVRAVAESIDVGEILNCTCSRVRRLSRMVTQVYEHEMEATGLTVGQFTLLGHLYGIAQAGHAGMTAKRLAVRLDMDPTTLSRTLRPLDAKKLIRSVTDPKDGRVRLIEITEAGRDKLRRAVAPWRRAQRRLVEALGSDVAAGLGKTLDRSLNKLTA